MKQSFSKLIAATLAIAGTISAPVTSAPGHNTQEFILPERKRIPPVLKCHPGGDYITGASGLSPKAYGQMLQATGMQKWIKSKRKK